MAHARILVLAVLPAVAAMAIGVSPAAAKGCIKGAIVGGVAGHYAGHHGVIGAIGGCIVGRHHAKEKARAQRMREEQADHGDRRSM